jgi:hypothetical protein
VKAPRCGLPVVDAEKRAMICGAPATTTREIEGIDFAACPGCAAAVDAKQGTGAQPFARVASSEEMARHDADARARWDAEQAKLPPAQRRTYDEASADDEAHMGRQLRRGRDRGLL